MAIASLEIRNAGGEVLVHDTSNGKIHVLNATAGSILERCDGATSIDQIAQDLATRTGADRATVSRDVASICERFQSLGLITANEPTPRA